MEKNISEDIPKKIYEKFATNKIKTKYSVDLNIVKIHESIVYKFGVLLNRTDEVEKNNEILKEELNDKNLSIVEKNKIQLKIDENLLFINNYRLGILWKQYISKSKQLLLDYIPLASDEIKGIININTKNVEDPEIVDKRLVIIEQYLHTASKYIDIDATWDCSVENTCPICDEVINTNELEIKNICNCGYIYDTNIKSTNYIKQNSYNGLSTFIKALDKFEGTYVIQIPEKLYESLDSYFIKKGIPPSSYFKSLPLNSKGQKDGTNIDMLIEAFSKTSNSTYYHVINIICANYWEWKLPDLTKYREILINDYKRTQQVYDTIKNRNSNLNINIRLYCHLKSVGYDCDFSDFKMLSTRNALEYHNKTIKEMFEKCDIPFYPII